MLRFLISVVSIVKLAIPAVLHDVSGRIFQSSRRVAAPPDRMMTIVGSMVAVVRSGHADRRRLSIFFRSIHAAEPDLNVRAFGDVFDWLQPRSDVLPIETKEGFMARHTLVHKEIGMICIYLKPREKTVGVGSRFFAGRPLYRESVIWAKASGIMNAVAHHDDVLRA